MSIFIWNGNHSFSIGLPLFFYIAQSVVLPTRQAFHHVKFRKPTGFENIGMAKFRQDPNDGSSSLQDSNNKIWKLGKQTRPNRFLKWRALEADNTEKVGHLKIRQDRSFQVAQPSRQ